MATPPRANLSREEPDAGNLHVRVCEGWGDNVPTYSAAFMADRREVAQEGPSVSEWREAAEEGKPAGVVECDQPGEEQAAEQLAQDTHRQEERRSRRDPALSIEGMPPPGW